MNQDIRIILRALGGEDFIVDTHSRERVGALKITIFNSLQIPASEQRLVYFGRELTNDNDILIDLSNNIISKF